MASLMNVVDEERVLLLNDEVVAAVNLVPSGALMRALLPVAHVMANIIS
jgi:hypothetical protein